jgi:hypothetical protein
VTPKSEEIALLRGVVAALRESRKPPPAVPVRSRWPLLLVAFALGFALGATLIAVTR